MSETVRQGTAVPVGAVAVGAVAVGAVAVGGRPVALIADDEPDIRRFLAMSLEQDGFTVHQVGSGTEALAWLEDDLPDVVVLDHLMPGVTGLDVAAAVRDRGFPGPVILFSAFLDSALSQACERLDVFPLSKVDTDALHRVGRALAAESLRAR